MGNDAGNKLDPLGLTSPDQILAEFFDIFGNDKLWVMHEDDEYTKRVRKWASVQSLLHLAEGDLKRNCDKWKNERMTDPNWKPSKTGGHKISPTRDPYAFPQWTPSLPLGTDPNSAMYDFAQLIFVSGVKGTVPNNLWYSAIGDFGLFVTVDEIDCCNKKAKLNVWMYNAMTKESFSKKYSRFFWASAKKPQYIWWNWKEDYDFGQEGFTASNPVFGVSSW